MNYKLEGVIPVIKVFIGVFMKLSQHHTALFFGSHFCAGPFPAVLHSHIKCNPKLLSSALNGAKN